VSRLRVEGLHAAYDGREILGGIDLDLPAGELHAVLGPSGCGKSTLLRCIAGLKSPTSGRVLLEDEDVTRTSPERRGVALLHQEDTLFPHLDVRQNVAFGLRRASDADERVRHLLELVGLPSLAHRRVHELSGGERQRVALARALAIRPRVLLLDEPLSHLDQPLRVLLRADVRRILREAGATALYVTHDREEAFALADGIVLLDAGRVVDHGGPARIHEQPGSAHAARLLGRRNILEYRRQPHGVETPAGPLPVALPPTAPAQGTMALFEEELTAQRGGEGPKGRVEAVEYLGGRYRVGVRIGTTLLWAEQARADVSIGDEATLDLRDAIPRAWPSR